jgi:hypothetical protein
MLPLEENAEAPDDAAYASADTAEEIDTPAEVHADASAEPTMVSAETEKATVT